MVGEEAAAEDPAAEAVAPQLAPAEAAEVVAASADNSSRSAALEVHPDQHRRAPSGVEVELVASEEAEVELVVDLPTHTYHLSPYSHHLPK